MAWRDRVLGSAGAESAVAVLPANQRPLSPLPAERRRAFLDHLAECAAEASSDAARNGGRRGPGAARPAPARSRRAERAAAAEAGAAPPLLSLACATCRGQCCGSGGTHAYLGADEMRRYLGAHPGAGVDDVLRAYAAHLPESSYTASCVFHGRAGCTLPRDMRGRVCNAFQCSALSDLRTQIDAGARTVFAAAGAEGALVRGAIFDAGGIRRRLRRPRFPPRGGTD